MCDDHRRLSLAHKKTGPSHQGGDWPVPILHTGLPPARGPGPVGRRRLSDRVGVTRSIRNSPSPTKSFRMAPKGLLTPLAPHQGLLALSCQIGSVSRDPSHSPFSKRGFSKLRRSPKPSETSPSLGGWQDVRFRGLAGLILCVRPTVSGDRPLRTVSQDHADPDSKASSTHRLRGTLIGVFRIAGVPLRLSATRYGHNHSASRALTFCWF